MVGTTISHYKVIEKIDQGGMGAERLMVDDILSVSCQEFLYQLRLSQGLCEGPYRNLRFRDIFMTSLSSEKRRITRAV